MKRIELTVRLTEELHARLVNEAHRQGISLNALIQTTLAGKLGENHDS